MCWHKCDDICCHFISSKDYQIFKFILTYLSCYLCYHHWWQQHRPCAFAEEVIQLLNVLFSLIMPWRKRGDIYYHFIIQINNYLYIN
jgi:hypothetical protein